MVYRITEAQNIRDSDKHVDQSGKMPEQEIQAFKASEVNTYKCTVCDATGENNWKLHAPKMHRGEIEDRNATCKNCGANAIIFND